MPGVNIAGILQILNLEHRNTELESDNSQLKIGKRTTTIRRSDHRKENGQAMTINFDTNLVADEVPVADAVEQQQPADLSDEDAGLDPEHVADRLQQTPTPST